MNDLEYDNALNELSRDFTHPVIQEKSIETIQDSRNRFELRDR